MEITTDDLRNVIQKEPMLVYGGFLSDTSTGQDTLLNALNEVRLCYEWLTLCERRKRINEDIPDSYGLKHRLENDTGMYVSNGAFIAATIIAGIPYRKYNRYPNIHLALSSKCKLAGRRYNYQERKNMLRHLTEMLGSKT